MFDDPRTVQQLRTARLIEAEEYRLANQANPRVAGVGRPPRRRWWRPEEPVLSADLELFEGLDRRTRARLAQHFLLVDLAAGESLARQGETASEFVVVLDGRVGVTIDGLPIAVFDEGSHFGAIPLIDGGAGRFARASFDVLEPTRVAIADRIQFFTVMERFPVVADRITRIAERRRAYLAGHADAKALAADRDRHPYPVHMH